MLAENGKIIPALENRPHLLPGLSLYFTAYRDLSYDRPVGMGVGNIPWSSIIKWCQINNICDINDIDTVIRYIRKMEQVDIDLSKKKAKK